jgi:pheromone alpha factor receptor
MSSTVPTAPDPNSAAWNLYIDSQSFNLTSLNGTQLQISLVDVNQVTYSLLTQVVMFSFTLGFNGMLLIVLLILIDRKKARQPIYLLNFVCLLLNTTRSIVVISVCCSQYIYGIGEYFLAAVAQYPFSLYATPNVIGIIFNMIMYACILASLVLQVRVIFSGEPRTQLIVTVILAFGALLTQSCWMAFEIKLIQGLFGVDPAADHNALPTLDEIVRIIFLIVVSITCLLFLCKLLVTINRRRRMGFQSFGTLHILFIMVGQCLVIPRKRNFSINLLMKLFSTSWT